MTRTVIAAATIQKSCSSDGPAEAAEPTGARTWASPARKNAMPRAAARKMKSAGRTHLAGCENSGQSEVDSRRRHDREHVDELSHQVPRGASTNRLTGVRGGRPRECKKTSRRPRPGFVSISCRRRRGSRGEAEYVEELLNVVVREARQDRFSRALDVLCFDRASEGVEVFAGALDQREATGGSVSREDCSESALCGELLEVVEAREPPIEVVLL